MGALTAKPYAFNLRPWELHRLSSFDICDSLLLNVKFDFKGLNILRVLPSISSIDDVSNIDFLQTFSWISDRTRFVYDALCELRLGSPVMKLVNKRWVSVSWIKVTNFVCYFLLRHLKDSLEFFNKVLLGFLGFNIKKITRFKFFIGDFFSLSDFVFLKNIVRFLPFSNIYYNPYNNYEHNERVNFCSNFFIDLTVLNNTRNLFLFGIDLRLEFPVLLLVLKKLFNFSQFTLKIFSIGRYTNLNVFSQNISSSLEILKRFCEGKLNLTCILNDTLSDFFSYFFFGESLNLRFDFNQILDFIKINLIQNLRFCFLHNDIGYQHSVDFGFNLDYRSSLLLNSCRNEILYNFSNKVLHDSSRSLLRNKILVFQCSFDEPEISNRSHVLIPVSFLTQGKNYFRNIFGKLKKSDQFSYFLKGNRQSYQFLYFLFRRFAIYSNFNFLSSLFLKNINLNSIFEIKKFIKTSLEDFGCLSSISSFYSYYNSNLSNKSFFFHKVGYLFNVNLENYYCNILNLNILIKLSKLVGIPSSYMRIKKSKKFK